MSDPLLARVLAASPALPFVTLVHWLERLLDAEVDAPGRGPITLRHDPALSFHAQEAHATPCDDAPGVAVITAFAGLTGAASPLPTPLLEALARDPERELPEHALLDVLQHRLLALLYRGLRAHDLAREGGADHVADWMLALAGLPADRLAAITALPRESVLRLAPLLIAQPPTAARLRLALHALLADLLTGADVQIHQLRGGAVALAPDARVRLGRGLTLGRQNTLGARCPAPAAAIAVVLASLSPAAFLALRPGGTRAAELTALVRLLVPESIDVDITLRPVSLPTGRLGSARLCATWLAGRAALPSAARVAVS